MKLRFLCLTLLTLTLLCSCNAQGTNESKQTSANTPQAQSTTAPENQGTSESSSTSRAATSQEVSIKITPPEGWTPVEGSVLQVQYMKNTASFMVKAEPLFAGKTLDDVSAEAISIFKTTFDDFTLEGEPKSISVDGKEAVKVTFTCTVSKLNMKYQYVYLFVNNTVYSITFGDLADSFDSYSADYETILSQIKF